MKIFLDTANINALYSWQDSGLIDGVTTNPSLLSHEGGDPKQLIVKICALVKGGDISIEVTEKESTKIYEQAKLLAKIAPNIVVKIPCHKDYYGVIQQLCAEKIPINATLVFTLFQGLMMCKLGVKYISPFVGRWDDMDVNAVKLIHDMRHMIDRYKYSTKILAASLRSIRHIHEMINAGADIVTLSVPLFEQAINNILTDRGMAQFDEDWKKLGVKQFP